MILDQIGIREILIGGKECKMEGERRLVGRRPRERGGKNQEGDAI